ncbi:MAG: hypothetical protein J0H68_06575 [Sphingobacteriia bacterium]|nr:hypothetical protein [Sphingobacteriia bacterium]
MSKENETLNENPSVWFKVQSFFIFVFDIISTYIKAYYETPNSETDSYNEVSSQNILLENSENIEKTESNLDYIS